MLIPENTYELVPEGTYSATCVEVCDCGTQPGKFGPKHQVRIAWEIADHKMTSGKPFVVSRMLTLSGHEKAGLRTVVEGMTGKKLGKGFDMKSLLGLPCLISIQHSPGDTPFANVTSVVPLPKGTAKPAVVSKPIYISLIPEEFDEDAFRALPEKRQAKIGETSEWRNLVAVQKLKGMTPSEVVSDEIPF